MFNLHIQRNSEINSENVQQHDSNAPGDKSGFEVDSDIGTTRQLFMFNTRYVPEHYYVHTEVTLSTSQTQRVTDQ